MKVEPQDDDLDRLLSKASMPEAPAWFETRVMARLRREKDGVGFGGWLQRHTWQTVSVGVMCLILAGVALPVYFQSVQQEQKVFAALDALDNYDEDVTWDDMLN